GAVNGIYPTDAASQVEFRCFHSGSRFLFVEDEEQLDKFLEVRRQLPAILKVIVFDMEGLSHLDDPVIISFETLLAWGAEHLSRHAGLIEERLASRQAHDLAVLVYTSGTTG